MRANNEERYCKGESSMDEVKHFLYQVTHYIGKETIHFHKFPCLCFFLVNVKTNMMEKLYHNEKLW